MISELRIDQDVAGDPLKGFRYKYPLLDKLAHTLWLNPVEFAVGSVPVSFQPGLSFKGKAYHTGQFLGTMQFGIDTHFIMQPMLTFESEKGLFADWKSESLNTKWWPPSWLVFTEHFEMGVVLEPELWLKGGIGEIKDAMA